MCMAISRFVVDCKMNENDNIKVGFRASCFTQSIRLSKPTTRTRKLCYRKNDRAMCPIIYEWPENCISAKSAGDCTRSPHHLLL